MKKSYCFLFGCLLLFSLSACGPDPVDIANGYAIQQHADDQAAANAQRLKQEQEIHDYKMENLEAAQVAVQEQLIQIAKWIGWAGRISALMSILALGIGLSVFLVGSGRAGARAAIIRAHLIPLDARTRQYPLYLYNVHNTRYALVNPNTNSVVMLDAKNPVDRQMIASVGAVQLTGLLADNASKFTARDPSAVSIIQPVTEHLKIGVSDETIPAD
jgi:hypothetical protein